jgi:hypothetical protein
MVTSCVETQASPEGGSGGTSHGADASSLDLGGRRLGLALGLVIGQDNPKLEAETSTLNFQEHQQMDFQGATSTTAVEP